MPVGSNWHQDDLEHRFRALLNQNADEHLGHHFQVQSAQEAAERGWFYRREWYLPLEPDTRKCRCHGEVLFDPLPVTDSERAIRAEISPNRLLGEPPLP